ncbi:MAG: HIT family protein [Propioniciclava sp.]
MTTERREDFAGAADPFDRLWTPHRMVYIGGENKPADASSDACPFCRVRGRSDEDALIVHRGDTSFVVLNLYPYNPGHLLVCPNRHVSDYTDLTIEEAHELGELTASCMRVLRAVSGPDGFNLGVNQGEVAGAGIAAHLHQHVVPRWRGDANFLPVVGRTKAVPQLLADTRHRLAEAWAAAAGTS